MPSACFRCWERMRSVVSSSLGHENTFGWGVAQNLLDGWSLRPQASFPGVALVVFPILVPPLLLSGVLIFKCQLRSVCSKGEK